MLPSPDGGLLALENHLTLHGMAGRNIDLMSSSRKLPENTNQLPGPHILSRHIKGQIFCLFADLWI